MHTNFRQKLTIFFLLSLFTTNAQVIPEMVFVKGGSFLMGSNDGDSDEKPIHSVRVSDFYIGKYEITVAQYRQFCKETKRSLPIYPNEEWYEEHYNTKKWTWKNRHPISSISWNDANSYCKWLSAKLGKKYRLPTEAEWEYAAKGGSKSKGFKYSGSNTITRVAWFDDTTFERGTRPIGTLMPNELGIYDMSGNVWEWCYDRYGKYSSTSSVNPKGSTKGAFRCIRGGSWYYIDDMSRVTARDGPYPHVSNYNYGFRVVREK